VTPYTPKSKSLGDLAMQEAGYHRRHVKGQNLVGEMIPKASYLKEKGQFLLLLHLTHLISLLLMCIDLQVPYN
jgi:hypothetical protein